MARPRRGRHGGAALAALSHAERSSHSQPSTVEPSVDYRPTDHRPRDCLSQIPQSLYPFSPKKSFSQATFCPNPLTAYAIINREFRAGAPAAFLAAGRHPVAGGGTLQKSGSPPAKAARAGSAEESAQLSGVLPSTGSLQGPLFPPSRERSERLIPSDSRGTPPQSERLIPSVYPDPFDYAQGHPE